MNILLVDDDPIYLTLLSEILRLYSHHVLQAADGEAAIALLKRETVDVIISDVSMPRMNGVHLHTAVREDRRTKKLPFIWNSGYQELRDLLPLSNPSLDFKFDKATELADLLYTVGHLAAVKYVAGKDEARAREAEMPLETPSYS